MIRAPRGGWTHRWLATAVAVLIAVVAGTTGGGAGAATTARKPSTLQRSLAQLVKTGVPGAIVLVRDGQRTVRLAAGAARLKPRTPMRPTDRFRGGSVTKTFVAAVVLQLVAEEKLTLDDSVERWLPGVVPNGDRITVRQLLNHTSGIYNYSDDVAFLQTLRKDPLHAYTPAELVRIATSHTPAFEPGTSWAYSNTNYVLLGLVVEAATGKPLPDELRVRIFEPLRLIATSFPSGPELTGRYAHGYSSETGRLRDVTLASPSWTWAAGALVSSADDLATFYGALLGGRVVPAGLRPELLRVVPESGYALGILRARVRCGTVWGHTGSVPGYTVATFAGGNGRRQVVVFVNADSIGGPAAGLMGDLLETAYCRAGR